MHKVNGMWKVMLTLLLIGSVFSCKPYHRFAKANRIETGYMTHYRNDSLELSILYNGDYSFDTKQVRIPKPIRKSPNYKSIRQTGDRLFFARSTVAPKFCSYGFVQKTNKNAQEYLAEGYIKYSDSIYVKPAVDSLSIYYLIKTENKDVLVYNTFVDAENKDEVRVDLVESMLTEFDAIRKSIRLGSASLAASIDDPFQIADSAYGGADDVGNYLKPLRVLANMESKYAAAAVEYRNLYLHALLTCLSFVDDTKSQVYFRKKLSSEYREKIIKVANYELTGGSNKLLKLCEKSQVIMFNEDHTVPAHRQVVTDLLPALYKAGFRYLALEALGEDGTAITKRGYPTMQTGFYTREPRMANLIRTAVGLGFTLVDYEDDLGDGQREINQARNLYKKTLEKDPTAKIIVLAGHDHINEATERKRWMANEFRKLTNIDPLTINQTEFADCINADLPDTFSVAKQKIVPSKNDLYIINRVPHEASVASNSTRPRVQVELTYPMGASAEYIVQLYHKKELDADSNVVPCYVKKIDDSQAIRVLLPEGMYTVLFVTDDAMVVRKQLTVSDGRFWME